jgi:hypothetical protein
MTVLVQALRSLPCRPRGVPLALTAREEAQLLFGLALVFLIGGGALVLHALSAVTAFQ